MREILFKGKNMSDNKWVYGYIKESFITSQDERVYWVDPETVGQYTGIKDKNDIKIFEWDIIKTPKYGTFVVTYNERFGCFVASDDKRSYGWEFLDEIGEIEVIGNIHDDTKHTANHCFKLKDLITSIISHNEIIAIWEDCKLLWQGEGWKIPEEYKNKKVKQIFGCIPESIDEADVINIAIEKGKKCLNK